MLVPATVHAREQVCSRSRLKSSQNRANSTKLSGIDPDAKNMLSKITRPLQNLACSRMKITNFDPVSRSKGHVLHTVCVRGFCRRCKLEEEAPPRREGALNKSGDSLHGRRFRERLNSLWDVARYPALLLVGSVAFSVEGTPISAFLSMPKSL